MSRISLQFQSQLENDGTAYNGHYLQKGTNGDGASWLSPKESTFTTWMLGSSSNNNPTTLAAGSKYNNYLNFETNDITATYCPEIENCKNIPSVYIKAKNKKEDDHDPIQDGDIVSLYSGESRYKQKLELCLSEETGLFYAIKGSDGRVAYFKIKFLDQKDKKDKKKLFIIAGAIIGALLLLILIMLLLKPKPKSSRLSGEK